jgi:hypothetical protein
MVVQRFKAVVGTILAMQMPLPISAFERLAHIRSASDIHAVLRRMHCTYWTNLECADTEDAELVKECEVFASEHLLHWLETLSWVGKLDIAHRALRSVQKLLVMYSLLWDG